MIDRSRDWQVTHEGGVWDDTHIRGGGWKRRCSQVETEGVCHRLDKILEGARK